MSMAVKVPVTDHVTCSKENDDACRHHSDYA
jgi:hypothetical protein